MSLSILLRREQVGITTSETRIVASLYTRDYGAIKCNQPFEILKYVLQ